VVVYFFMIRGPELKINRAAHNNQGDNRNDDDNQNDVPVQ
jgi:hypothetical protein